MTDWYVKYVMKGSTLQLAEKVPPPISDFALALVKNVRCLTHFIFIKRFTVCQSLRSHLGMFFQCLALSHSRKWSRLTSLTILGPPAEYTDGHSSLPENS